MSNEKSYRNHPNNPAAQPFMGAPTKKPNHWSNRLGHNNVARKNA